VAEADLLLDPTIEETALFNAPKESGPLAPEAPAQAPLEVEMSWEWKGHRISAVAGFGVEAVVLSRKHYGEGDLGTLVPWDLALAWGQMSDPSWIRHLRVRQEARFYHWHFPPGTELTQEAVETQSANMHFLPGTPEVAREMERVRNGDLVRFSGFLVDIEEPNGAIWKSSRVRTDTGSGACEIILIETFEVVRGTHP